MDLNDTCNIRFVLSLYIWVKSIGCSVYPGKLRIQRFWFGIYGFIFLVGSHREVGTVLVIVVYGLHVRFDLEVVRFFGICFKFWWPYWIDCGVCLEGLFFWGGCEGREFEVS